MAGGLKKHLKRIATPKHWCLDKLGGIYAPRPTPGPHKIRECIPMALLLRNRLNYALTYDEVKLIVMQRLIKVDGKVRTDKTFPLGFMDIVSIEKTKENFRMLLDTKGRFKPVPIEAEEAKYKFCRVRRIKTGHKGIPYAYTHDGRTIRFIHPEVKVHDTIKIELATNKVVEHIPFKVGACVMATAGRSTGRVGHIVDHKKTPGAVDMVNLKDARGEMFSTKIENVFVIGAGEKPEITLPKGEGVKKTILEVQQELYASK